MKLFVIEDIDDFVDSLSTTNKDHKVDLLCKIWDMLRDLEKQIEKVRDGRMMLSSPLLSELLDDLIFTLQHPTFLHFFAGKKAFNFDYDSLVSVIPDESEVFLKILHVLFLLPKDDTTATSLQDGLCCNIDYISRILEPRCLEHKWVLDCGFEFRLELAQFHIPVADFYNSYPLIINRNNLVQDSIVKVMGADALSLSKGVVVKFENEDGIGEGVVRDWLISLVQDMVDNFEAFQCSGDEVAMDHTRIYPKQGAEEKYPDFYHCFGRLLALALIHEIQIGITLDRTIFQQLAENDINLEDIRETAPSKFKLYSEILLVPKESFGLYILYDRVDNRRITFEEREKFIAKEISADFVDCIKAQTGQIIEGVDDIISFSKRTEIFQIIRLEDLDYMIRGIQELNTEDWVKSTTYEGYMDKDPVIIWFWQCVADLSEERKRKLLFFWAAMKYLPVGGFGALNPRLVIRNRCTAKEESREHLPVSNTCISTLTLPPYESYDVVLQKLLFVIDHDSVNFELR